MCRWSERERNVCVQVARTRRELSFASNIHFARFSKSWTRNKNRRKLMSCDNLLYYAISIDIISSRL